MARSYSPDKYTQRAKQAGYAARSVYKLAEIDERFHLLKAGQAVLELGCAPGSWLRYTAQKVGPEGRLTALDILPVNTTAPVWVDVLQMSVHDFVPKRQYDLLLSDMAPNTSGDHSTDALRSAQLCEMAMQLAQQCLRPYGSLVMKLLEGRDMPALVKTLKSQYKTIHRYRPQATRKQSTEIFLLGLNRIP